MTVETLSRRWHSQWDDGWNVRSSGIKSSDKLPESIYGAWHVSSFGWFLSQIEASLRLPCTSPIKINLLPLISLLFAENILSKRARHPCQRSVHSTFCITRSHPLTLFLGKCCEILKYSQVYEPYRSIVGQERGRTHRNLNERRKIN